MQKHLIFVSDENSYEYRFIIRSNTKFKEEYIAIGVSSIETSKVLDVYTIKLDDFWMNNEPDRIVPEDFLTYVKGVYKNKIFM